MALMRRQQSLLLLLLCWTTLGWTCRHRSVADAFTRTTTATTLSPPTLTTRIKLTSSFAFSAHKNEISARGVAASGTIDKKKSFTFQSSLLVPRETALAASTSNAVVSDRKADARTKSVVSMIPDTSTAEGVIRFPSSTTLAKIQNPWKEYFVPALWQEARGVDARIHWDSSGSVSMDQVATSLLQHCFQQRGIQVVFNEGELSADNKNTKAFSEMQQQLSESLQQFTRFCLDHYEPTTAETVTAFGAATTTKTTTTIIPNKLNFSARIVSSRGSFGTKCPVWHLDHVPCRWIQALAGPGVVWIPNAAHVNWTAVNALNENDNDIGLSPREKNKRLVPKGGGSSSSSSSSSGVEQQAKEGEAVVLIGNRWIEFISSSASSATTTSPLYRPPVVHKSPDIVQPWQGRVLLTMDVVMPFHDKEQQEEEG